MGQVLYFLWISLLDSIEGNRSKFKRTPRIVAYHTRVTCNENARNALDSQRESAVGLCFASLPLPLRPRVLGQGPYIGLPLPGCGLTESAATTANASLRQVRSGARVYCLVVVRESWNCEIGVASSFPPFCECSDNPRSIARAGLRKK